MASNQAVKRRAQYSKNAAKIVQTSQICKLPDNIMLIIFSFLDIKSLCAGSKVCRRWYHLGKDRSLWRSVDLRPWPLALRTLWKVVRNRISESVIELQIKGFIGTAKKNDKISLSLLEEIKTKCPNLEKLTLCYCDMRNVDVRCLPYSLKSLSLDHSIIPLGWFDSLKTDPFLKDFEDLNLTYCTRVSDTDVNSIGKLSTLKRLNVSNCYRITDYGVQCIATKLANLTHLDLSDCTQVTDLGLHHIGRHLINLRSLSLQNCRSVTDTGIGALVYSLKDLNYLSLSKCHEISDTGLASIAEHCKKLAILNILECPKITSAGLDSVKTMLPNCAIERFKDDIQCTHTKG